MPELAEVYFHAQKWKAKQGECFDLAWLNPHARCCKGLDASFAQKALQKVRLENAETHGKRMLFSFTGGLFLEVHLGMTGSLAREENGYERQKHDHFALRGEHSILVFRDYRMFGKVALHKTDGGLPSWWLELPPQPQERGFTSHRFLGFCERRKGAVVKPFLLQQDLFPGVGNWMADEILWRARIAPTRRVGSLSSVERLELFKKTRWVCRKALEIIGSDYSDPPKSWLFQHRWRDGGTCPKTRQPLVRETVGGRTTCWSPSWQL